MKELEAKEEQPRLQTSRRSRGNQHAGMQKGDLLQTPAIIKPRWKNALFHGRFQEFCQLSLKTRLQPQSCFLKVWGCVDPDQRMWFMLALLLLTLALQSISLLMQWMWVISFISLKLLVYLKLGVGVLWMVIKASRKEKSDLMEIFKCC